MKNSAPPDISGGARRIGTVQSVKHASSGAVSLGFSECPCEGDSAGTVPRFGCAARSRIALTSAGPLALKPSARRVPPLSGGACDGAAKKTRGCNRAKPHFRQPQAPRVPPSNGGAKRGKVVGVGTATDQSPTPGSRWAYPEPGAALQPAPLQIQKNRSQSAGVGDWLRKGLSWKGFCQAEAPTRRC